MQFNFFFFFFVKNINKTRIKINTDKNIIVLTKSAKKLNFIYEVLNYTLLILIVLDFFNPKLHFNKYAKK